MAGYLNDKIITTYHKLSELPRVFKHIVFMYRDMEFVALINVSLAVPLTT